MYHMDGVFNKCELRGRASSCLRSKEVVMTLGWNGLALAGVCVGGRVLGGWVGFREVEDWNQLFVQRLLSTCFVPGVILDMEELNTLSKMDSLGCWQSRGDIIVITNTVNRYKVLLEL